MLWFANTNTLLSDVSDALANNSLRSDEPLISYSVKIGIIIYSSEFENDFKELISNRINGYKNFCQLCNRLRNPKYSDISEVLKALKIPAISIDDSKKKKLQT